MDDSHKEIAIGIIENPIETMKQSLYSNMYADDRDNENPLFEN